MKGTSRDWTNVLFQAWIAVVTTAGVTALGCIYTNLTELNERMAVVVEKVTSHDSMIRDGTASVGQLELRIRALELEVSGAKR